MEFPPVQRVVTLNDLAPSTQRHLSATPPSLPPRTPKSKAKSGNQHSEIPENNFFTFTPTEERKRERKQQYESEKCDKNFSKVKKEIVLEDSLGKRLFQNEHHPIYIEDENLSQQL